MQIDAADLERTSVNEVIRRYPATVAVFNQFGIDACCGGAEAVAQAALRDGTDPAAVVAALVEIIGKEAG